MDPRTLGFASRKMPGSWVRFPGKRIEIKCAYYPNRCKFDQSLWQMCKFSEAPCPPPSLSEGACVFRRFMVRVCALWYAGRGPSGKGFLCRAGSCLHATRAGVSEAQTPDSLTQPPRGFIAVAQTSPLSIRSASTHDCISVCSVRTSNSARCDLQRRIKGQQTIAS